MPGRPRDAALAQETILRVARAHFVAHGLAGARIDVIAREAGYSKAMIYHYYGSKEALYVAVLEASYRDFVAPRRQVRVAEVGPVRALEAFIREGAASIRRDPSILSLLGIENLHEAAYLRRTGVAAALYPPLIAQLREIVEAGERQGVFRAGIDPVHLYVSLSSLIFHAVSNRFTLAVTLSADVPGAAFLDRQVEEAVAMVVGYCRNPPPAPAATPG
ncbi:TetR family transcriptional regulator [Roseomonas sp. NAR14]|uniref:TetR family transcriptional regulator n=1 Tax=Roseomonas acroporae TaxID=2937791 RepID=A0A9X2BWK6_9PROT|nr:TetR family transcriptional regulator [Roseomonas acroporae]